MKKWKLETPERIMLIVFLFWLVIYGLYGISYRASAEQVTITIQEKDRISEGETSRYLVWTYEDEVFENTDSLFFWKFNSSDVYGELLPEQEYCVLAAGWRVPFLSMYRNIIRLCD